jgi:hypothetical protein
MCVCVYTVAKLFDYPNLLLYALFPQLKCWEEGGRSHSLLVHVVYVCVCVYTVAKLFDYPNLLLYALFPNLSVGKREGEAIAC